MQLHKWQLTIWTMLLTILILTGVLQAAVEPTATMSLEEALRIAMAHSSSIVTVQLDHTRAEADLSIAWRNLRPKVNLQSSYTRLDEAPVIPQLTGIEIIPTNPPQMQPVFTEIEGSPNIFNTQLSVQQPLFVGGRAKLGIELAEMGVTMTEIQGRSALNDLCFQVIQSYYNVLLAGEMVEIQQNALKLLEEHQRIVEVNYQQGLTLKTDLLKVDLEKMKAEQSLRSAENTFYLARRQLGIILGQDAPAAQPEAPVWVPEVILELENLYAQARQARPELQVLNLNRQMLAYNQLMEERSYWPNVMLVGNYNWKGDKFTLKDGSWNLTVSASMPIYDGGISQEKLEGLAAQQAKLEESENSLTALIRLEIEEALLKTEEAKVSLSLQQQGLANAEENLRIAGKAFELDAGTSLDVLNAQNFAEQAALGVVQSRYQYQLGLFKILYKSGQLVDYCKGVIYRDK